MHHGTLHIDRIIEEFLLIKNYGSAKTHKIKESNKREKTIDQKVIRLKKHGGIYSSSSPAGGGVADDGTAGPAWKGSPSGHLPRPRRSLLLLISRLWWWPEPRSHWGLKPDFRWFSSRQSLDTSRPFVAPPPPGCHDLSSLTSTMLTCSSAFYKMMELLTSL